MCVGHNHAQDTGRRQTRQITQRYMCWTIQPTEPTPNTSTMIQPTEPTPSIPTLIQPTEP